MTEVVIDYENPIRLFPDGDQWCALYGPDLQEGRGGFGDTPEDAIADLQKSITLPNLSKLSNWITSPL